MRYKTMIKNSIDGDHVIGRLNEDVVHLHKHKENFYTNYGVKVDIKNPYLKEMVWNRVDGMSKIMTDILHQFITSENVMNLDFNNCSFEQCKKDFNNKVFDTLLNRQMYLIKTTEYMYTENVFRILSLIKNASASGVYDHIYVFVKDEHLYGDNAKKLPYSDIFNVTGDSALTFTFVREKANVIGFINDIFDIKPGKRILRIYDQRVTADLEESDFMNGFFMSQQERDDCVYFWNDPEKCTRKPACPWDEGQYCIDLYGHYGDPHFIFHNTLGRIMEDTFEEVNEDEIPETSSLLAFDQED